jgi:tRNA (uracil-5-)-methyltransferase
MASPVRAPHAVARLAAALRRHCCASARPLAPRAATADTSSAAAPSTSTAAVEPSTPPYKRASRGGRRRRSGSKSASPPPPPAHPSPARCPLPQPPPGSVDPPTYAARLDHKVGVLTDLLASVGALPPPATSPLAVFPSPPAGYRARAEFRVWHDAHDVFFAMFDDRPGAVTEPGRRPPKVRIEAYPVGSPLMGALMAELLVALRAEPGGNEVGVAPLRSRLFQANFLTTTAGEAVVTLVYHRTLDEAWKAAAEGLRARLEAAAAGAAAAGGGWAAGRVDVVGRSRGQRVDVARNYATERLDVGGTTLTYRHVEGAFSQPNPAVCASMLAWAAAVAAGAAPSTPSTPPPQPRTDDAAAGGTEAVTPSTPPSQRPDDLLELYCGGGTFTAALAPVFRRVLATEVSRASVAAAAVNLAANGLGDGSGTSDGRVIVLRSDAADVAAVLANCDAAAAAGLDSLPLPTPDADPPPMRIGGRAPGAVDPRLWNLRTLFVDPPRAGVGAETSSSLFPRFDRILYISCNPATLAADVAGLTGGKEGGNGTHVPVAAALFDQFPFTDHIEAGLLLERRKE